MLRLELVRLRASFGCCFRLFSNTASQKPTESNRKFRWAIVVGNLRSCRWEFRFCTSFLDNIINLYKFPTECSSMCLCAWSLLKAHVLGAHVAFWEFTGRPDERFGWLRTALEAHGAFWEIMERSFGSVGILVVGILVLGFWEPKSDRNRSHAHLEEKLHVVNQKYIMTRPFLSSSQHNCQAWAFILLGNCRWEILFSYDFPTGIINFYKFPTKFWGLSLCVCVRHLGFGSVGFQLTQIKNQRN